jgi:hypothetical protein
MAGLMEAGPVDEVRVEVTRVTDPTGSTVVEVTEVLLPGEVDAGEVREAVLALLADNGITDQYVLTENRVRFEWGASVSTLSFVLEILQDVGTEALLAGLYIAARKAYERIGAGPASQPVSVDYAVTQAKQKIYLKFRVSADELIHTGEQIDLGSGAVTVHFTGPDGTKYAATVARRDGLLEITQISRLEA